MIVVGVDPGSKNCGVVACAGEPPFTMIRSATVPVDPDNIAPSAVALARAVIESRASVMVYEWSWLWAPANATIQQAVSMGRAHEMMARVLERVKMRIEGEPEPPTMVEIAAGTWRKRIRCEGRGDTAVLDALIRHLGVTVVDGLRTVHERDAMGAVLGYYLSRERRALAAVATPRVRGPTKPRALVAPTVDKPGNLRRVLDAIAAHGRPIRLDVLTVRVALPMSAVAHCLAGAVAVGAAVKVSRGVYALPGVSDAARV